MVPPPDTIVGGPPVRAATSAAPQRGPRARRPRGDVRRRPRDGRIPARVALVKALASALCIGGGVGGARGADRADRLGARIDHRSGCACRPADAGPGRLRRRRRDRGHLQRTPGGRVLRDGTDPGRLRRAVLRHGRPGLRHGQRHRPGRAGQPPFLQLPTFSVHHAGVLAFAALGLLAGLLGCLHPRALRDRGRLRLGMARPRVAAPGRRRAAAGSPAPGPAADVRRGLPGPVQGRRRRLRPRLPARAPGRQDDRHQPDHRHRRVRWRLRTEPVHRRHGRVRVRRHRQARRTRARRPVAPTA